MLCINVTEHDEKSERDFYEFSSITPMSAVAWCWDITEITRLIEGHDYLTQLALQSCDL